MRKTILFILLVGACRAPYRPPAGNATDGAYPFKQVITNANPPMTLEGTVIIMPDTVVMTLSGKSCSPEARSSPTTLGYVCGQYGFWFNRENPLRTNRYNVPTMIWRTRPVCDQYRENPTTKAEQCVRYRQERYESRTVISGALTFLAR
jgi:hypothetical protein